MQRVHNTFPLASLSRPTNSCLSTFTSLGADMPMRTWLPLMAQTVTLMSLPMLMVSPIRLVKMSKLITSVCDVGGSFAR